MKNKALIFISIFIIVVVSLACKRTSDTGRNPQPGAAETGTPDYSGPCTNVLYPFIPGRQWIYQRMGAGQDGATPDPLTSKFGLKVEEIADSRATLTSLDLSTGATTETTAECREGAITSFPLIVISSLFGNYLMGDIQSEYVSGVFAPSKAELDAADWNMEWEGEYVTSGTITFTADGEETAIILNNSPVSMTWRNDGQETITVPAGTYEDAYRVTCTTQIQASISLEGLTGAGVLTFKTLHWFAPYVGLLKSEIDSSSLTVLGFTFPLDASGSVELFEIR